jgi:hypothetical protein
MTEQKKMDPRRLAIFRQWIDTDPPGPIPEAFKGGGWVRELLAHADFWEAEAKRLRPRVQVQADDAERAGVTWRHVKAWLVGAGWTARYQAAGQAFRPEPDAWTKVIIGDVGGPARAINTIADHVKRIPLDVLDEIAALTVGE